MFAEDFTKMERFNFTLKKTIEISSKTILKGIINVSIRYSIFSEQFTPELYR